MSDIARIELVAKINNVARLVLYIKDLKLRKDKIAKTTIKECGEKLRIHKLVIGLKNSNNGKMYLYLCLLKFGKKQIITMIRKLSK